MPHHEDREVQEVQFRAVHSLSRGQMESARQKQRVEETACSCCRVSLSPKLFHII